MSEASGHFGPYQLLYPLGAGGMGQVFLARHEGEHGIQRVVAIKLMLARQTRRQRKMVDLFLDEVRIASQLNHGNIIQVVDHGVIDGQYFMAMEYVHGENLLEVVYRLYDRKESMALDLALHVGSCICQGLSYAHGKKSIDGRPLGIVHRDVSPQNIMLTFQGEVKVADFGVARAAEQTHETVGGELKGKLAYMSPEQAFGRPLDHRSDLFSLGVVLYEILSGSSPFLRENPMATLEAVRAAQVVSLATVRHDLPREVVELVHQTLSPAPDRRPDSARTMYEDLQRIMRLHNMVVSAFDLADFMADVFPESRQADREGGEPGGTAVGRRADEQEEALERRTLFYLQQRHPDLQPIATALDAGSPVGRAGGAYRAAPAGETAAAALKVRGRQHIWIVGAGVVLLMVAGWVGLYRWSARRGGSPADAGVQVAVYRGDAGEAPRRARDLSGLADGSATPAATAWLVVRSRPPGAWVTVAGQRLPGTTPLRAPLSPGRHGCAVGLAGHHSLHRTIRLRPGQTYLLEGKLEPHPGRVGVTSSHGCQVKINGKGVGRTPVESHPIPPGEVTVSCSNPQDLRRVRVAPGKQIQVRFRFGTLAVNLQPWAQVKVDGRVRGTTPLMLLLPVGEHRVVLSNAERGLETRQSVEIREVGVARISSW